MMDFFNQQENKNVKSTTTLPGNAKQFELKANYIEYIGFLK